MNNIYFLRENKLHILFLTSWYPSRVFPTNGNFVQKHAEAIALNHKVTVIYPVGDSKKTKNNYEITDKTTHNVRDIVIYFKKHPIAIVNAYRKYKALKKGMKLIDNFDIIHANVLFPIGILVLFIHKKYGKPYIFTEHWTGYLHPVKAKIHFFKKLLLKLIVQKAAFIVPVSKTLKSAMQKFGLKGNYKIIGNAIDTSLFSPKKNDTPIFTILHVSYLTNDHKNIKGLLRTIKELSKKRSDFIFKIIGDGDLNAVKEYVNDLQIPSKNIDLKGPKEPSEIAKSMQEANLYISFSNYETFGVVLIEALATHTPVISTNTGVLTEYNTGNFCTITPMKDEKKLLFHIENYMDNKCSTNYKEMRDFAISNFSYEAIATQYSELYNKALFN